MKEDAIYLVPRAYPNTNGGTQHNIGTCKYLTRYFDMTMISLLDSRYAMSEAEKKFENCGFNLIFYYSGKKKNFKDTFCMLESVDMEIMNSILQIIKSKKISWVFFTIKMLPYMQGLKRIYPGIKYIYVSHNAEYRNIMQDIIQYDRMNAVNIMRHIIKLLQGQAFIMAERQAIKSSDMVFSISEYDSELLAGKYHTSFEKFILNKPMIPYMRRENNLKWKDTNYTNKLLTVRNMNWYPTVNGTIHFIDHIFTKLKTNESDLQLFVVGANPAQELIDRGRKDTSITITGYVKSVSEYYEQCDIAIVPIYEGTGAKLKVLEALGNDIPVVITEYVAKDYEGIQNAAIVCENDDEMLSAIRELIGNELKRKQLCEKEEIYYSEYMKENRYVDRYFEGRKKNCTTE